MPNWVINQIYIRSKKPSLRDLVKEIVDSSDQIDFNKVIPMPDEMQMEGNIPHEPSPELQKLWDARTKKYGAGNWYDWSIKYWGTKWNASEGYFDDEANRLVFNTAWDEPKGVLQKLADRWGVTLGNRYHDEYDNKWHTSVYKPRKAVKK